MSNPSITIVGRIGTEPEFKNFGGNSIVKFRLITSDRKKSENGQWEDVNTSGWNIVAWNNVAESCKNILQKGQEIVIIGTAKEDSWTDSSGLSRKSVEINASNVAVSTYSIQKAAKTTNIVVEEKESVWA